MPPAPTQRIKVAYVIDTLDSRTGGTEGQLLQLLDHVDRSRYEPVLFCLESSPWLERAYDPARVRVLDIRLTARISTLRQIWAFSRILKRERFQIVQTHFRDGNTVGVLAGWLAGVDGVISTRRGEPYWMKPSELAFLKWLDRRVTWFVANSRATRDRYARLEGFDPARVDVIYNGLDPARFRPLGESARLALRESVGLPADALAVGIVANLRTVKGLQDFLAAAQTVAQAVPRARFVLVGEGDQEQALREQARQLGIGDRVLFLGSREDVPRLLQMLDVGVLSSHFESFSNSILEYVAAGLPVVVTDVGGAREVVHEGRNGFIVPARDPAQMADRIVRLLTHPGGSRAWRQEAQLDEVFHLSSMVAAHERLYARLAAKTRRAAGVATAPAAPGAPVTSPPTGPDLGPKGRDEPGRRPTPVDSRPMVRR